MPKQSKARTTSAAPVATAPAPVATAPAPVAIVPGAVAAPAAGVLTPEARDILDTCNRIASAYVAGAEALDAAKAAVGRAENGQLRQVQEALIDPATGAMVPGIDSARWKAVYASPVRMALKASGKLQDGSIGPAVNRLQLATIALTHGVEPESGESLKAFAGRVKDVIKASGWYMPENAGNENASGGRAGKAAADAAGAATGEAATAVSGIDAACLVLARGDLADAELFRIIASDPAVLVAVRALVGKIHKPE